MLTEQQIAQYDREGYLILPDWFSAAEVAVMKAELARLSHIQSEEVTREKSGTARTVFRVHDRDSATASDVYYAATRLPRTLGVAQQVTRDEKLYLHHSKCNLKAAVDGAIWQWHQDFGSWQVDGIARPDMTTMMVMVDEATEMGGCLYFLPGSHKYGRAEAWLDSETTGYKIWVPTKQRVLELMEELGDPVPVVGKPGTAALLHPNMLHGSGHNMSPRSRWHVYLVYNPCANRPADVETPRPEWVRGTKWSEPLQLVDDDAILRMPAAAE